MESHGWTMRGPLNTDNIRAQDGTLAATITDGTGYVNFQNDIEARDIDTRRDMTVFRNLEVQGPLAHIIQNLQVDGTATIEDLVVSNDLNVTRDLNVGRDADVSRTLEVGAGYDTSGGIITKYLKVEGPPLWLVPDYHPAPGKMLGTNDTAGNCVWLKPSIPVDEIILFYTNTQVDGYELQTLIGDDDVVYITKGTGAGGQAGGAAKPAGTWTQPVHNHGVTGITLPAHNHKWMDYISKGVCESWASNGVTKLNLRTAYGITGHTTNGFFVQATSCNANNPAGDFWVQNSSPVGATGNTDNAATASSWRPKGRNFTMQKRIFPS